MKKILKIFLYIISGIIAILLIAIVSFYSYYGIISSRNIARAGIEAPTLTENGFTFKDLNKNGKLDPYEDSRRPTNERVDNLLSQMVLEEKAGIMFISMIAVGEDGSLFERPDPLNPFTFSSPINSELVVNKKINHFNIVMTPGPKETAIWNNNLQKLAERTRLGIPITIASDPRHAFSDNPAANVMAGAFSKWCEPLGFAAARDSVLVAQFGDIARQEYLALGIRLALHPMADLATEPRWARINGTFGEDAELAARMTYAYIKGFQGDTLGPQSIACMTKHFAGGGPQKDGWDAHFPYGQEQAYPGKNFDYHLIPFEKGAFKAGTAQIMPYYGIPVGQTSEDVGFAFNKEIITDLLRNRYGFDGVVCSDWSLLTDKGMLGMTMLKATGWGVENLSVEERILKALEAGIDQFGGESLPEAIVQLVKDGRLEESRIDISIRRLLRDKFRLGLFDNPYVDVGMAEKIVGKAEFQKAGALAQRKSIVLLKNADSNGRKILPLRRKPKIYIENIDSLVASQYGKIVKNISTADFAILRLQAPFDPPRGNSFLEGFFHQGNLEFTSKEKEHILKICKSIPTIIDIFLDRPAVIPEIAEQSIGLLANFGASDTAVLDVMFGKFSPTGKLPFELPSSMDAVRKQKEDVPYDSEDPLFPFGFGLTYEDKTIL